MPLADSLKDRFNILLWNKQARAVAVNAQVQTVFAPFNSTPFSCGILRRADDINFADAAGHEKLGLATADVHA